VASTPKETGTLSSPPTRMPTITMGRIVLHYPSPTNSKIISGKLIVFSQASYHSEIVLEVCLPSSKLANLLVTSLPHSLN